MNTPLNVMRGAEPASEVGNDKLPDWSRGSMGSEERKQRFSSLVDPITEPGLPYGTDVFSANTYEGRTGSLEMARYGVNGLQENDDSTNADSTTAPLEKSSLLGKNGAADHKQRVMQMKNTGNDNSIESMDSARSSNYSNEYRHSVATMTQLPYMTNPVFGQDYLMGAVDQRHIGASNPDDEMTALLQRLCSDMYVAGNSRAGNAHVILGLGGALPGASVELLREGAFLHVRLSATNEMALRTIEAKRARLLAALGQSTNLHVTVDVISREGGLDCDVL